MERARYPTADSFGAVGVAMDLAPHG
jgi:hypothetical protein